MVAYLLRKYPEVIFGGDRLDQATNRCAEFWRRYQCLDPDHMAFQAFTEEQRAYLIPLCMHGDKGRTLKKSPIANYSIETVWGLPSDLYNLDEKKSRKLKYLHGNLSQSCGQRAAASGLSGLPGQDGCTVLHRHLGHAEPAQKHNTMGHSFLSKFLVTAVPYAVYSADPKAVLSAVLCDMAECFKTLFHEGLSINGTQWYVACLGCKGDAEFHVEAGQFWRSYQNVGTVTSILCCHHCECADDFSDVSDHPSWLRTAPNLKCIEYRHDRFIVFLSGWKERAVG